MLSAATSGAATAALRVLGRPVQVRGGATARAVAAPCWARATGFATGTRGTVRVMANGVWDLHHFGHANAWLQAKTTAAERLDTEVELVVAVHDGMDTERNKGKRLVYSDAERVELAEACEWVDEVVPHVPYDVITEALLDLHDCAYVAHGDDLIALPGKPHMYSEVEPAGRFILFPRTPGVSTTDARSRAVALANGDMAALRDYDGSHNATASPAADLLLASFRGTKRAASPGDTTVYIEGTFDLYNVGDLEILREAASKGDRLVVGVRAETATVYPLLHRALTVLSNECVDDVVVAPPPRHERDAQWMRRHGIDREVEIGKSTGTVSAASVLRRVVAVDGGAARPYSSVAASDHPSMGVHTGMHAAAMSRMSQGRGPHAQQRRWHHCDHDRVMFPSSVVGSLPRPAFVKDLVFGEGADDDPRYEQKLEAAIKSAVALQLQAGCDVVTDGEWGRRSYIGVIAQMASGFELYFATDGRPMTSVVSPVRTTHANVLADEARRLKRILTELGVPDQTFKITLPAPALLGERMWDPVKSAAAYPTVDSFVNDCVPTLRDALTELAAVDGSEHIQVQVDDPHLCLFAVDEVRAQYDDPEAAAAFSVDAVNAVVDGFGDTFAMLAVHLCRRAGGRARGEHEYDGSLGRIVEHVNNLKVNHLTLECTHESDINVLKLLRPDFEIGLGCVSVDPQHIDTVDEIRDRVSSALDAGIEPGRLVLNPDCGFAPGGGAVVDLDEVYTKLVHQAEAAKQLRKGT